MAQTAVKKVNKTLLCPTMKNNIAKQSYQLRDSHVYSIPIILLHFVHSRKPSQWWRRHLLQPSPTHNIKEEKGSDDLCNMQMCLCLRDSIHCKTSDCQLRHRGLWIIIKMQGDSDNHWQLVWLVRINSQSIIKGWHSGLAVAINPHHKLWIAPSVPQGASDMNRPQALECGYVKCALRQRRFFVITSYPHWMHYLGTKQN